MRFKIDWANVILGSKFSSFALFYFVFEGNFPRTSSRGAYIWKGDLTEGFSRYRFGGLILGGAYTWRGLFSGFYGNSRKLGSETESLYSKTDSFKWSVQPPSEVRRGSPAILEWTVSLNREETEKANLFSLIVLEREMFLYSNRWQIMAVKVFSGGAFQEVGNKDTFNIIPGSDMKLKLNNVTDTDGTRFRCTFLSSFAAPKSIIQIDIKGRDFCG